VSALTARDAERVPRFVADADDIGGDEPFAPELLGELAAIVPADWVAYQEKHAGAGDLLVDQQRPSFDEVYAGIEFDCIVARDESPVRNKQAEGFFGAIRLTGLMTRRELHRTRYHSFVLGPLGVRDILTVAIPSGRRSMRFQLDRTDGAFTERDRAVLDALQPHLARMRFAYSATQRLRASLTALARASVEEARGVVLLDAGGSIEFASPPARRLLRAYFDGRPLAEVLDAIGPQPVTDVRRGNVCLRIERVPGALLLRRGARRAAAHAA
jgi:hypothetical protein